MAEPRTVISNRAFKLSIMKPIFKSFANKAASALLLAFAGCFMFSCSKETGNEQLEGPEVQLSVSFAGVKESPIQETGPKASSKREHKTPSLLNYGDYDAELRVDNRFEVPLVQRGLRTSGVSSSRSDANRAAAIPPGIKYRLFLFQSGVLKSSTELESGGTANVAVQAGQSYQWYALSYNTAQSVPDLPPNSTELDLPMGKDVLHAAGELSIPAVVTAPVQLPITFRHKTSRIAIELNSMGLFGVMSSANVTVSGLSMKTGKLNITTGVWSELKDSTQTLNWNSFVNLEEGQADRKVAYAFTVDSTVQNNIVVSVSSLNLAHSDGITRNFTSTNTFPTVGITPVIGNSHRVLLNMVESPLRTTQGGVTVNWARSNLYYSPGRNPYRFYAVNQLNPVTDGRGYFAFGGILPRRFQAAPGDPCALVYPEGVWRQPTNTETAVLTSSSGLLSSVLGSITGLVIPDNAPGATFASNYVQYTPVAGGTSTAFDAASNVLRFYYNGQVTNINVITTGAEVGLVSLALGDTHAREAALWSKTGNISISLPPLINLGLGAWGYHARNRSTIGGTAYVAGTNTAEPLSSITVGGLGVLESTLKNVRCVRN